MTRNELRATARSWRPPTRRLAAVAILVVAVAVPGRDALAQPGQEPPTASQQAQTEVAAQRGQVQIEVDLLSAHNSEVQAALASIEANVATQQSEFDAATGAADLANADLAAADAAVVEAQGKVDTLNLASDILLMEAYVSPPMESSIDTLSAESMSDALIMQAVLKMQADEDKSVLELLTQARDDLSVQRDNRANAASAAETARVTAEAELAEAESARAQQAQFAIDAEAALDHKLTEAENLATLDAALSAQIAAEQAERARQLEEARLAAEAAAAAAGAAPPGPVDGGGVVPLEGGLASASCHDGGAITVAESIGGSVQALLDAAAADGLVLCGGGYRSSDSQIALREAHCGSGYYNIYVKPASQCRPPTARPGTSMHEKGLAVDFRNCSTRSTACYRWLSANAGDFGLYNLPSEAWHWSVNGN